MEKFKKINEEMVYSEAHAKEILNIKANYNKALQELNNRLAKQLSDLEIKYMKIEQQKKALGTTQAAAKTAANAPSTSTAKATGTVTTAGQPVNAQGNPPTVESYSNILKVKQVINEESFDTSDTDQESIQDLKNYMDAEDISYIEDEDETTLDFDVEELDDEWKNELENLGLQPSEDVETDDILDYSEDNDENEDDIEDIHDEIDEEKVFYVKVSDNNKKFIGKIYKLFSEGDWRSTITKGESKTFEKLNFDPEFDEFDIIAFLRENYDDAELIDEDEFNYNIENSEEDSEIQENHHIPTYEQFLNENS